MLTYKNLFKICVPVIQKELRHLRTQILHSKGQLSKQLLIGQDKLMYVNDKPVRPTMYFKSEIERLTRSMEENLELVDTLAGNARAVAPTLEDVSPRKKSSYSYSVNETDIAGEQVLVKVRLNEIGWITMAAKFEDIFDKKASVISKARKLRMHLSNEEGTEVLGNVHDTIVKIATMHQLGTYFTRLRGIKAVNFLRNLKGTTIFLQGEPRHTINPGEVYANKVNPSRRKQKRCDWEVTIGGHNLTRHVTISRGALYFTDKNKKHLWTATAGKTRQYSHIASVADCMLEERGK